MGRKNSAFGFPGTLSPRLGKIDFRGGKEDVCSSYPAFVQQDCPFCSGLDRVQTEGELVNAPAVRSWSREK